MKVFVILAHPEHQSFNGAMFRMAVDTPAADGHEVRTSDLYAMQFNPISSRQNFITIKDPDYFKPQIEEIYATEVTVLPTTSPADQTLGRLCRAVARHRR